MRFTKTIASATVAAVLGIAGVSVAGATANAGSAPATAATTVAATGTTPANTAQTPALTGKAARKAARKARRKHFRRQAAAIAAKTIGITPADLVTELKAGKTIADIATEHGSSAQAVISAIEAAGTAQINAAQAAGKITAARAAKMTTRLDTRVPKIVNTWHRRTPSAGGTTGA